jgi:dephospho-CoA kinase
MILIGLTGSIGMGKSETARMFRRAGVPVYDADAAVHALMRKGGAAVKPVEAAFPGVVKDGAVDRPELGKRVFGKPEELRRLERIVHPLVGQAQRRFLQRAQARGAPIVVLDIPLLFETGGNRYVDYSVVVSAPPEVQRRRVLARPGMTEDRLRHVLAQQTPDVVKRRKADFVVHSGLGKAFARNEVERILGTVREAGRARVWPGRILLRRR